MAAAHIFYFHRNTQRYGASGFLLISPDKRFHSRFVLLTPLAAAFGRGWRRVDGRFYLRRGGVLADKVVQRIAGNRLKEGNRQLLSQIGVLHRLFHQRPFGLGFVAPGLGQRCLQVLVKRLHALSVYPARRSASRKSAFINVFLCNETIFML